MQGLKYLPSAELAGVKGKLFVYKPGAEKPTYRATQLKIEGSLDKETFNPHGITSFSSKGWPARESGTGLI